MVLNALQGDVIQRVKQAKQCVIKTESDRMTADYSLLETGSNQLVGEMRFRDGHLYMVDKDFSESIKDKADVGRVIFGLLHEFQVDGRVHCDISTSISSNASMDVKDASVICGNMHIDLSMTRINGADSLQIFETLGSI